MAEQQFTEDIQKRERELQTVVGEYLAAGLTNGEILQQLEVEHKLTLEEARAALRGAYDTWSSVREGLNLQKEDDRNWHKHLRMKLLQKAIKVESTPSQRLALQILDSLAGVEGIATAPEQIVPLSIELVSKEPEPEKEDGDAQK